MFKLINKYYFKIFNSSINIIQNFSSNFHIFCLYFSVDIDTQMSEKKYCIYNSTILFV